MARLLMGSYDHLIRLFKSHVSLIIIFCGHLYSFTTPPRSRWQMRGAYPSTWMLFSSVMLSMQFVGSYCGTNWCYILPQPNSDVQLNWFLPPHRKPPDPTCHVKILLEDGPEFPPPTPTYTVNNVTYEVSKRATTSSIQGSLIDRGANGGLAGRNVCVLNKHHTRSVDVQGIDNHQINDIPIVTAAGVVTTQRGELILIMNQYAHVPSGKTIHSSAQLESHGVTVDDKAIKNGGTQRIITHGGYVIPLSVRSGLAYMDIRPPTDAELYGTNTQKGLPHIILTSDLDWNPSSLDYKHDEDTWFDAMENLPDLDHDLPFDEFGEYIHTHELATSFSQIEQSFDTSSEYIINVQDVITSASQGRTTSNSLIDFEKLAPYFGWLPLNVIQATMDKTTQFYCAPASNQLKKHFKSPYPACNVQRRQEPLATDTVYSDTPAIDNGCKVAQIFVGTESLVTDVFGMKTEKQFVNTLQDIIRQRGAPTKLISDSAQVEISNKVHNILRYLFIEDWQSEAYHQHQNPAERRYQDLKRIANRLMDRTGSPPSLWLLALQYTAFLLNHTSCASLDKAIPMTILTGVTQDISILLCFHWYEKVYFRANESSFPSESPEQSGYFVGFAENVGNALTFAILTIDTNKIIYRSEVRSATDPKSINLRSDNWGVHQQDKPETEEIIKSRNDGSNKPPMAYIDAEDLVGKPSIY